MVPEEALARACAVAGDLATTCRVLCVSKSARLAVLAHCMHTVKVELAGGWVTDLRLMELSYKLHWLGQYGSLVQELRLKGAEGKSRVYQNLLVSSAVQLRAVRPQRLTLACLQGQLLAGVDPTHLTQLVCAGVRWSSPAACSALGRLTGLVELELYSDKAVHHSIGLTLASLTRLTHLRLSGFNLPEASYPLLPCQLRYLILANSTYIAGIAHLTQLQQLELQRPRMPAKQLRELSRLGQLQRLFLQYEVTDRGSAEAHAGTWPQLPSLTELELDCSALSSSAAAGIAGATSLTSMRLTINDWQDGKTLRSALQPLRGLRQLTLVGDTGVPSLAGLAGALTALTSLGLWSPLKPPALVEVCRMSQLRQLVLMGDTTDDQDLLALAEQLQQLRVLGVDFTGISLEGLLAVLEEDTCLPQLQRLAVAEVSLGASEAQRQVNLARIRAASPGRCACMASSSLWDMACSG